MPITIGSNIASLRAQRRLNEGSEALSRVYERLSSGQRINRASDDAAGLAIASSLNADSRVYGQGLRNINDAVSTLNIAQGAVSQLATLVVRQRELAEQAANSLYSSEQRNSLEHEANALVDEYNRIISTTSFNGLSLLDAPREFRMQTDYGINGSIAFRLGDSIESTTKATGTFTYTASFSAGTDPVSPTAVDINEDGKLDIVGVDRINNKVTVLLGNGNGSFQAIGTYGIAVFQIALGDLNGDNQVDFVGFSDPGSNNVAVAFGNGNGTFGAPILYGGGNSPYSGALADIDSDGDLDIVAGSFTDSRLNVLINNGNGTFKARVSYTNGTNPIGTAISDFDGDGILDIASSSQGDGRVNIYIGNGNGTFKAYISYNSAPNSRNVKVADFNGDGIVDLITNSINAADHSVSILLGNGNGTFKTRISTLVAQIPFDTKSLDLNGDGIVDLITDSSALGGHSINVFIGNGNGSFFESATFDGGLNPHALEVGDFNGDGVEDLVVADYSGNTLRFYQGESSRAPGMSKLDLSSAEAARDALTTLGTVLTNIETELSNIGSIQSRFDTALSVLRVNQENAQRAAARITDADIASESAALTRTQILQQAASAVLTQANQQPTLALKLLQGG